jgi:hypothetical protein
LDRSKQAKNVCKTVGFRCSHDPFCDATPGNTQPLVEFSCRLRRQKSAEISRYPLNSRIWSKYRLGRKFNAELKVITADKIGKIDGLFASRYGNCVLNLQSIALKEHH